MTIDYTTVRLYTCCKCGHKWTNWDRLKQQDSESMPLNCPHCRNVRWNQYYREEDLAFVQELIEQHYAKKNAESMKSVIAASMRSLEGGPEPAEEEDDESDLIYTHYFDFIAHDFLYKIKPMPDVFELKQVLAIPQTDIEARHKVMLSIIHDRITNKEKYIKEHYSKFEKHEQASRSKYPTGSLSSTLTPDIMARRKMSGCKHKEHSIETLIALYRIPPYRLSWYYYQYDFEMRSDTDYMPDAHSQALYKKLDAEVQRLNETEIQEDEAKPEFARAIRRFKEKQKRQQQR